MSSLKTLVDEMRSLGIRAVAFKGEVGPTMDCVRDLPLEFIELSDTIPAPPPPEDESFELPEEPKPAGICKYAKCGEPANSGVAHGYCRPHGLKMCGVGHV